MTRPLRRGGRVAGVAAALALLTTTIVSAVAPSSTASANVLAVDTLHPVAGPLGPITVVGDSVMLGGGLVTPTLSDRLVARGWGPVRFRASVGMSTGTPGSTSSTTASYWIERWRAEGWDTADIVVNLGANDSGLCGASVSCARGRIGWVLDAIGPGHRVWWPKITRYPDFADQAAAWNQALDQLAAERDDLYLWDWPTVMYREGQYAWDHTHLTGAGYIRRNELMSTEITADLARATRRGTDADLPPATGEGNEVVPIGPVRVVDTREGDPGRLAAGQVVQVDVSGHLPEGATAAAVYVTATQTDDRGYLTAYDCDDARPTASAVNYGPGETRGAVTITPVSESGRFCLFSRSAAHVVVDLQAAFVPTGSDGTRFTPLASPERLLDTRATGRSSRLEVAVPDGAELVAVSLAAIGTGERGFLTAFGCTDDVPLIATVNHGPNEVVGGTAFVPVSDDGTICVFMKSDADVTIDLTGTFAADGALVFVPITPTRTVDTRSAIGGWGPIHGTGQTIDAAVAPDDAAAVSGTLTIIDPLRPGHLRAWSCGELPETANVNARPGQILANSVTTGVDDAGRLCLYARAATNTVFDTAGWWIPAP